MGKKPPPPEDLIIPPQDSRICGTICICQMTAVLSSVAIVYLTVAVYMPTLRAFQSGMSDIPAMCTTTLKRQNDTCPTFATCTEWCLSKGAGACTQIYVNLRRNGSSLTFANCTNMLNKTCYGIDEENVEKKTCIKDHCKNLTGTFNCTKGVCINITDAFECIYKETELPKKCSGRRGKVTCELIQGLHDCEKGLCSKILSPYNCDRRCTGITTRKKNVILLSGDKVHLSQCQKAYNETGTEVWNEDQDNIVMASCYSVNTTETTFEAVDCINGSLLEKDILDETANFTYLNYLSVVNTNFLDKNRQVAPPEIDLLLANESRLSINMESCVNTLKGECDEFFKKFGKDGSDHSARARFPCYYDANDLTRVVAKFDLQGTYSHFLFASILPCTLFVVSCSVLATCQKTVEVGDDAKMRFKGCNAANVITAPGEKGGSLGDLGDGGGNSAMAL